MISITEISLGWVSAVSRARTHPWPWQSRALWNVKKSFSWRQHVHSWMSQCIGCTQNSLI